LQLKLLEVIFLPEAEVVELLASFTTWAIQLANDQYMQCKNWNQNIYDKYM
jgi:hypothetical protein